MGRQSWSSIEKLPEEQRYRFIRKIKGADMKWTYLEGTVKPINEWAVLCVVFFLIAVIMVFIAYHNSKPLDCSDIVTKYNVYTKQDDRICEVLIK